ncbi:ASCH domain-containing protein [Metasolibacillus sp.]|uniref:ASCH domain-containing protein n=1 Tax=Metasolibacillus sp. TaxID=2703680 RepID=UPI0025F7CBA9|nr:ASCH domain-containing protein [Metasolibacillus sp.]MCT6925290.1 ASCH domain-containing protein [Metasolibacillus sp.]MCT6941480.1 ASCH domain-containing protein [Metasolibacillus sp.]
MKAITITQPWASLIALGEKQFETRGWSTTHRGEIAIHAGKKVNEEAFEDFKTIFRKHGITSAKELLTGAVIATANLVDCHKVTTEDYEQGMAATTGPRISGQEYRLGDYTPRRYAWELDSVQHLSKPILAKGKLSLWEWKQSI